MNLQDLSFTDRSSYFAWKQEWKQAYADAVANVRRCKIAVKDADRVLAKTERTEGWKRLPAEEAALNALYRALNACHSAREAAQDLLHLRARSKVEADKQWHAARRNHG